LNQDELNQSEWNNLDNWSLGIYRSRKDTRIWVPKRRGIGWTINLGRKGGIVWMVALILMPVLIAVAVNLAFYLRHK